MTARVERRVLAMSERELEALLGAVQPDALAPSINGTRLSKGRLQEIAMQWLFKNGFTLDHVFRFEMDGDEMFVVVQGKPCDCCRRARAERAAAESSRNASSSTEQPKVHGILRNKKAAESELRTPERPPRASDYDRTALTEKEREREARENDFDAMTPQSTIHLNSKLASAVDTIHMAKLHDEYLKIPEILAEKRQKTTIKVQPMPSNGVPPQKPPRKEDAKKKKKEKKPSNCSLCCWEYGKCCVDVISQA